jgi:hypothetical protein
MLLIATALLRRENPENRGIGAAFLRGSGLVPGEASPSENGVEELQVARQVTELLDPDEEGVGYPEKNHY